MKQLTEEEFDQQFTPVPDAAGDLVRPSADDLDRTSNKLWTIVQDDDDGLYALSGWHYVNRVGFLLTEESWTEAIEAIWLPASDEESEDDEA